MREVSLSRQPSGGPTPSKRSRNCPHKLLFGLRVQDFGVWDVFFFFFLGGGGGGGDGSADLFLKVDGSGLRVSGLRVLGPMLFRV